VSEQRAAAERQNRILAELERLHMLLAPAAPRLRAGRPLVQDWDQVQQENLKQFEVKDNGKPLRR
jgi:hypothetical protein